MDSNHLQTELKRLRIRHGLAYVGEPESRGIVTRLWMTLKMQVLEGSGCAQPTINRGSLP